MNQYTIQVIQSPEIAVTVESDCDIVLQVVDSPVNVTVEEIAPTVQVVSQEPLIQVTVEQDQTTVEVIDDPPYPTIEIVLQGPQGPPGPQGPQGPPGSSLPFFQKVTDIIPANDSKIVDIIALNTFTVLDYIISLSNVIEEVAKGLKMKVVNAEQGLTNQVYSKTGDAISFEINTLIDGSNAKLEIVNNEAFDLSLVFVKTTL